jgi:hypothetical protein
MSGSDHCKAKRRFAALKQIQGARETVLIFHAYSKGFSVCIPAVDPLAAELESHWFFLEGIWSHPFIERREGGAKTSAHMEGNARIMDFLNFILFFFCFLLATLF